MTQKNKVSISIMLCFIAGISLAVLDIYADSELEMAKKSVDPDNAMRKYMVDISRQIGVTCTHCHNVKNFKDNEKEAFKIAKNHMNIVHWLNTEGFYKDNKHTKATCYMCHRGKAIPDFKETLKIKY